jgi:hypothetical protein
MLIGALIYIYFCVHYICTYIYIYIYIYISDGCGLVYRDVAVEFERAFFYRYILINAHAFLNSDKESIHTYIHKYRHIHTNKQTNIHTNKQTNKHTYIHTHIHTYIQTDIHTYTYIYIYIY